MTSTISPTRVQVRHPHLVRNVAMGAAAVALGVGAAFLVDEWTDSTPQQTPAVEVDVTERTGSPDAVEHRMLTAEQQAHEEFCRATAWTPDALEACLVNR